MYEKPVEVKGERPVLAHRNQEVGENLPREVLTQMDRIVTTDFRKLEKGRDYDRTGSIGIEELDKKGFFRSVSFDLREPVTLGGRTIYGIRLKGVTFNGDELDREFDLLEAHRIGGGIGAPAGAIRLDYYVNREGVVVSTVHVNEPLGGEYLEETFGEARGYKLCMQRGEEVDFPLCWYEYDSSIRPPNGLRLGAMAAGLTSKTRVRVGTMLGDLAVEEDNANRTGGKLREGWKDDVESVFLAYVNRVKKLHDGGGGLCHGSPHPGQFQFADGRKDRVIMSDLRDIDPLDEMTYPQRVGCMAIDIKPILVYALRYDSFEFFRRHRVNFLDLALTYFQRADRSTIQELRGIAPRDGGRVIDDVFNLSSENRRPLTFYARNPLIKAVMQEYPEV